MRDADPTTSTFGTWSTPSTARRLQELWTWLMLLGVLLAACAGAQPTDVAEGEVVPASTPSTTPTARASTVTPTDALEVAERYFDAYDAGDVRAMLDLFAHDVELSFFGEPMSTGDWWRLYAWKVAEGTELVDPSCDTESVAAGPKVTVTCEYGDHDHLAQVVDGPVVPFTMTTVVTRDGVGSIDYVFGEPDFNVVGEPFRAWMIVNHPDDADKVECCEWASVNEAREYGELTARYAEAWADHLEEHGCTYDEPCPTGTWQGWSPCWRRHNKLSRRRADTTATIGSCPAGWQAHTHPLRRATHVLTVGRLAEAERDR